ncbi:MAG: prepilin-type N-terminal cleavage/methylation domain-containing protein [Desulfovibrionaceae bacterium]|nr:prepilin-type N-terminal cleavage/methylation domain-containing protein [Desulfovibrionaceae bacterium]
MHPGALFNALCAAGGKTPAPGRGITSCGARVHARRAGHVRRGFTLLELAIVMVIMGVLIAVGVGSWLSMTEGRRIAKTVSDLAKVKECLVKRAYYSGRYPSYSANLDCSGSYSHDADVDECLCGVGGKDAWDGDLYFLEGVRSVNQGLHDQALVADKAEGVSRTTPSLLDSSVLDKQGPRYDVAFVLISWGKDGAPDDTSYGARLSATEQANYMTAQPDFSGNTDDIHLVVTSRELLAALKR